MTTKFTRRELLALAASAVPVAAAQHTHLPQPGRAHAQLPEAGEPDVTLRIGEISLELAPKRFVKTLAYNGQVPGPILRAREGRPLTVEVWNNTRDEELVHWHGFHIPSEVDGAREEGTPAVPPGGRRRYTFVPHPSGSRWYHSHGMTGRNLRRTTWTGQFGLFVVESGEESGAYDQEVPILLHEWEPRFTQSGGMDIAFRYYSINGKMAGAGEPIRVKQNQRVLFRFVNASATLSHRLALPGHLFHVTALDGFTVPRPTRVPVIELAPGERVDATVEMNQPGIWMLGETDPEQRKLGMGIVVEYEGQQGAPQWRDPSRVAWDYAAFAQPTELPAPDARLSFVFKATDDRRHWMINGKSHPRADDIVVRPNTRYRWLFDNQSAEPHPIHLHRHSFELVRVADRRISGVMKDVVTVPAWQQVEVDVEATQPGLTLFHCHQQFHMEMGFMALMRYST
jgi:FtsP/CotA-like multicopper oxidase with cupredoxin domain